MKKIAITLSAIALLFAACNKKNPTGINSDDLKKNILSHIANNVCQKSYEDMYTKALSFENACNALQANVNAGNLDAARNAWISVRFTWETTESWLFGPISANNIDPRIDTWPVDFNSIDSVLNTANPFTEAYINNLEDALKGFHPAEYFLWGSTGNKTSGEFTARQLEYLSALAHNLSMLSKEVYDTWKNGYTSSVATAGSGSAEYQSLNSAYIELVDAMSGICDEVANGKISEPFLAADPSLEESPFSKNSIKDFTQNIEGVMVVYKGHYDTDGPGIEDLVRNYNISLDQEVKLKHAEAIAALHTITMPFGEAIQLQPIQVQNTIDKINALKDVLDIQLKPFLLQYAK